MKHTKESRVHYNALINAQEFFSNLKDTMQEKYDAKSEKWQESEKGEQMYEDIDSVESIADACQSAVDYVEGAYENED